jgi:outer membrane protein TolC
MPMEPGLLPTVDVGGNALANRQSDQRPLRGSGQPDTYRSDQVNAAVGYELDLWGKARNELASRRDLAQAGDGDRRALELSLQAQLASSYFQLRGLDADIRLLDETCDAWQKSYDLTATLFRGKIAAQMDVSRARAQLEGQGRAGRCCRTQGSAGSCHCRFVGAQCRRFHPCVRDAGPDHAADPDGYPGTSAATAARYCFGRAGIAAANASIGVYRAALYPSIRFDAGGGVESQGTNPLRLGDLFWSLGPSVSLPIFDGGRRKAAVRQAQAHFREVSASYRATVLKALPRWRTIAHCSRIWVRRSGPPRRELARPGRPPMRRWTSIAKGRPAISMW